MLKGDIEVQAVFNLEALSDLQAPWSVFINWGR
jgi:hypothetical protein